MLKKVTKIHSSTTLIRKMIYFLVGGALAVLGIINLQNSTLFWKTYKNPTAMFLFKYPKNWNLCNESELKGKIARVFVTPAGCNDFESLSHIKSNPYFNISESDEFPNPINNDLKTFFDKQEVMFNKEEAENIKKGMLPTSPGFTQHFIKYKEGLIEQKDVSLAEVGENEWKMHYAVYNGKLYKLDFYPDESSNKDIRQILSSIKFSNN